MIEYDFALNGEQPEVGRLHAVIDAAHDLHPYSILWVGDSLTIRIEHEDKAVPRTVLDPIVRAAAATGDADRALLADVARRRTLADALAELRQLEQAKLEMPTENWDGLIAEAQARIADLRQGLP